MRQLRLFGAWLAALVVVTGVTWQIVSAAEGQVNDTPLPPIAVDAPATTTATGAEGPATTGEGGPSGDAHSEPSPTTTTTTAPTPTTHPGPTTSSSEQEATVEEWSVRNISTAGGSLVVRYRPGEVELQAATPAPGFQAEIEKEGPPDVRVEFEAVDDKVRVDVRWDDGGLDIEIS